MCEPSVTQASQRSVAMARSLCELDVANLGGRTLMKRDDGWLVEEPTYLGEKVVLDLTPDEDDWLSVEGVNKELTQHIAGDEALCLCMSVKVSPEDAEKLDAIDRQMKDVCDYSVLRGKVAWKNMHHGGGRVVLNLVLEDSAQPTVLKFVHDGRMLTGRGKDFLTGCLNGKDLTDFKCKARVLLECIHNASDHFMINVTVLSAVFAPRLRRKMVAYSEVEDAAAIRAAARLRYEY